MGIFDVFKKPTGPYKDPAANKIYSLLFCDDPELYKKDNKQGNEYPWNVLLSAGNNDDELQKIIADANSGSRVKLLAYHRLSVFPQNDKELLGVVVEVGLDNGLDVLASYRDGTARYINQTGKMIIWETTDSDSNDLTNKLFDHSMNIVNKIGPWDKARLPPPPKGSVRISFLVSGDLYFGEGAINVLFGDQLAGPALATAAELMKYLVDKATQGK